MLTQLLLCVQIAGLVASLVVLLVVVAIGFVFQPLPQVGEGAALAPHGFQLPVWQLCVTGGAADIFIFISVCCTNSGLTAAHTRQSHLHVINAILSCTASFSCLLLFRSTDGPGCHRHGEPNGDVQTVQRHPYSVEDQ